MLKFYEACLGMPSVMRHGTKECFLARPEKKIFIPSNMRGWDLIESCDLSKVLKRLYLDFQNAISIIYRRNLMKKCVFLVIFFVKLVGEYI